MMGRSAISKRLRMRILVLKAISYTGSAATPTYFDSSNLFRGTKSVDAMEVANTVDARHKRFRPLVQSRRTAGLSTSELTRQTTTVIRMCMTTRDATVPTARETTPKPFFRSRNDDPNATTWVTVWIALDRSIR